MKYYIKNQYNHIQTARRTNILWGIENGMEVGDIFGTKLTKCRFEEIDRANGFAIVLVTFSYHGKKVTDREIIMFSQTREFSSLAIQKFEAAVKQVEKATNEAIHIMVANLPPVTGVIPVETVETTEKAETATTETTVQPAAVDFRTMVEGKTIKIRVNGKVYAGRVVGFKLDFPKVWVREIDTEVEFSRQAIIRAVEGDRILEGGSETSVQPVQPVETAPVATTAPTQMPFYPLQNDAMFQNQIHNLFAKHHINVTSITKQDGPWYMDNPWQIDTDRGSFLLNRVEGDYDNWGITPVTVAVQTEEEVEVATAPVASPVATAPNKVMANAVTRFFWNGVKIGDSKKLIKVRYTFNKAANGQPASLLVMVKSTVAGSLAGMAGLQKNYSDSVSDLYLGDIAELYEGMAEYIPAMQAAWVATERKANKGDKIAQGDLIHITNELARLLVETTTEATATTAHNAPLETATVATVAKPNPVMVSAIAQEVSTVEKQSTNTHYYSPREMVTNKKFDLEDAPGEFLAEVRNYFGEGGAYRVKYVAPVITDIGKDYDGDDVFYQVLVVCISDDQFMMTKPKWQTNWQVMPFHGEVKVGDYLLDTSVETTTQDAVEVDNSHSPVAIPVTDNEWAEDFLAEMESSSLTRVRIWVLLYRAGLRDYRVSKRRPEQLSLSDLVNLGELETNLIISPEGDEVWDAGWECWRERTQEFITSVKAKTEATDIEVRYADSKRGDVQCLFLSSSVEEDRQAVIMMLQNGFIDGWDTLHYHLNTYRMLSNPYELNGFGAALVTSATGTCHRVPFVITYGGLPFNQQAIDEYHNFLSRNW